MEKAEFMQKPLALADSSRQYIERLWKIGIEVSKPLGLIASFFSSIFNTLGNTIIREINFVIGVTELSLTRFMFLFPSDLWSRTITATEGEYFPTEMERANVSLMFNAMIAKKMAAELARRVAVQTPKPALLPSVAPPLPRTEPTEEIIEEPVEEPISTMSQIVTDLQSRFESRLTPSIKHIVSTLQEYGKKTILLAPLLAMPKPLLLVPSKLEEAPPKKEEPQVGLPERPLATISEVAKVEPQVSLPEKPLTEISQAPPLRHKVAIVEPSPQVSVPLLMLRPEAVKSFAHAFELPSIVWEQEIPFMQAMTAFSMVSPLMPPAPSVEPSPSYLQPSPAMPLPMRPRETSLSLKEILPALTSWIYGVSEVLRRTSLSLSAVPIAASIAQKVVTETLIQPISSFEVPLTLGASAPVSAGLEASRLDSGVGRMQVEAFGLPATVASLFVAQSQRYPFFYTEPVISKTYEQPTEVTRIAPAETSETPKMWETTETKRFSKLPTVIALAAAESLIAHRLQHEVTTFLKETQIARPSYGETLSELGAIPPPTRTTMLSKLAEVVPPESARGGAAIEHYEPVITSAPPSLTKPTPVAPPVPPDTVNIQISAESSEEDLRDLESKINKILSEQLRRYYGSTRI